MLNNITRSKILHLIIFSAAISVDATDKSWENHQQEVVANLTTLEGWCVPKKACSMMNLIYETRSEICVEVGVFGGASIYPTASALKFIGKGQVYAIDPWENSNCLEGYTTNDPNYEWWNRIDLNKIYDSFINMLTRFKLTPFCTVMRMTGLKALDHFPNDSIDVLHIDGNHSEEIALNDVQMYFPKVKKGGYIWFDDTNWASTQRAKAFLLSKCEKIESYSTDEYWLFRK